MKNNTINRPRTKATKGYVVNGIPFSVPSRFETSSVCLITTDELESLGILPDTNCVVGKRSAKLPLVIRDLTDEETYVGLAVDCKISGIIGLMRNDGEPVLFLYENIKVLGSIVGTLKLSTDGRSYEFSKL